MIASLFYGVLSLGLGLAYLAFQYEVTIGWFQIVLGVLCVALTVFWMVVARKPTAGEPAGSGKASKS